MATTNYNRSRSAEDRFWEKTKKGVGCWLWTGTTATFRNDTRARFHFNGKSWVAARFLWLHILKRPLENGYFVLHECDNPMCVNPNHLFSGTQFDNMQDAASKGRIFLQRFPEKSMPPPPPMRGEEHPNAALTWQQVGEMRVRHSQGETIRSISADFPVTESAVGRIINGDAWKLANKMEETTP